MAEQKGWEEVSFYGVQRSELNASLANPPIFPKILPPATFWAAMELHKWVTGEPIRRKILSTEIIIY